MAGGEMMKRVRFGFPHRTKRLDLNPPPGIAQVDPGAAARFLPSPNWRNRCSVHASLPSKCVQLSLHFPIFQVALLFRARLIKRGPLYN